MPDGDGRGHILIVEDDVEARELLRLALERLGHSVVEAANGVAGVALALSDHPDIAFVDLDLPELDGYGVARRLRGNQDTQRIYLVALTGHSRESDRRRAQDAGFDEHVAKPMAQGRLADILALRLSGHAA